MRQYRRDIVIEESTVQYARAALAQIGLQHWPLHDPLHFAVGARTNIPTATHSSHTDTYASRLVVCLGSLSVSLGSVRTLAGVRA